MKNLLFVTGFLLLAASCATTKENKEVELGKSYGPEKVDVSSAITVKEMVKDFNGKTERTEYTFEADLVEVCSKAGCWVNIDKGNGDLFMVRFKNHFTIPPATASGTGAYLHGYAYMDTVSVADLRHFAEDAGQSEEEIMKITEPEYELNFEADGITLKK